MKTLRLFSGLCLAAQLLQAAEPADPCRSKTLLQEALFAEEAERDLPKAAAGYAEVLAQFEKQRSLAATALFRLAEIRAKETKTAEAIALHQRLVAEFPHEETLVKLSRDRLAALGAPAPTATAGGPEASAISAKEMEELVRLRDMVKNSPDLLDAPNKEGDSPLVVAATNGWLQAATLLLDHQVAVNGKPGTWVPLHWAASAGRKKMVELLLDRGADVNAASQGGWTAIHAASNRDRLEVARVLLERGANPNVRVTASERNLIQGAEGTPLVVAVQAGRLAMVKLLLEKGSDPDFKTTEPVMSPLGSAVELGRVEIATLLLEHHATVDLACYRGLTPLMLATSRGQVETAQLLLKNGARVDLTDEAGETALHYAAGASEPLVESLLAAGASATAVTDLGLTTLQASLVGRSSQWPQNVPTPAQQADVASLPKIWSLLAAKGADLNAVDANGVTVLHYACGAREVTPEMIEGLVKLGANPEPKGASPFSLVPNGGDGEALERALLFPKLVKEHAIAVFDRNDGLFPDPQKYSPGKGQTTVPALSALLEKTRAALPGVFESWKVTIYRADAEGQVKEAGSAGGQQSRVELAKLPKLEWGDVVVFGRDDQTPSPPTVLPVRRTRTSEKK